jgi:hypothetical protein
MVRGAHDDGIYCVDVGIVQTGIVPQKVDPKIKWQCAPNESLISFAEAKRLPVYPMHDDEFLENLVNFRHTPFRPLERKYLSSFLRCFTPASAAARAKTGSRPAAMSAGVGTIRSSGVTPIVLERLAVSHDQVRHHNHGAILSYIGPAPVEVDRVDENLGLHHSARGSIS